MFTSFTYLHTLFPFKVQKCPCTPKGHVAIKLINGSPEIIMLSSFQKNLVSSQKEVQERVQQREKEQKELSQSEENLKVRYLGEYVCL